MPDPLPLLLTALIGLFAGLLGGLAGIGGAMVILPGLHMLYAPSAPDPGSIHHRFMAAAMATSLVVSFPAMLRHRAHDAVRADLLPPLLISAALTVIAGVLTSNALGGDALRRILAAFIALYSTLTIVRALRRLPEPHADPRAATTPRLVAAGSITGFTAGLLGLGGGVLMVPLLQLLCRTPLRQSIATSSAVICLTAIAGATLKLATLHQVPVPPGAPPESAAAALTLAALMAPTAIVGARVGARLTHTLPLPAVRTSVALLLLLAAGKLASAW